MSYAPSKRRMELMCGGEVKSGYAEGGEIEEEAGEEMCPHCLRPMEDGPSELEKIKLQDAETAPGNLDSSEERTDEDFLRAIRRRARAGGVAA